IYLQDAVQPGKLKYDRAGARNRASGESGAGSAGGKRDIVFSENPDSGSDFFGASGNDYSRGKGFMNREGVRFIHQQLSGFGQDVLVAEYAFEFLDDLCWD